MILFRRSKILAALPLFLCSMVLFFSGCVSLPVENEDSNKKVADVSFSSVVPSALAAVTEVKKPADVTPPVHAANPQPPLAKAAPLDPPPSFGPAPRDRVSPPIYDLDEYPPAGGSRDARKGAVSSEDEKEKDIMEEALVLLDESHNYWVKGNFDDALQMLDQAYALLLDTNGNPAIARQKDDLRLMISKRILSIYNSHLSVAKGKRGEIPLISNADVEKEIKSFQGRERDFFVSAYYRSLIYRPIISAELKKEGLPDELSWLPLVESWFKISALSPARALGLWQFIPSTGYKYGLNRDEWVDERMDIKKSTRAAISYLKDLHAMFGDWLTVLASYNCGEGRVMRTIASQQINYLDRFWDLYQKLPNETARYVPRFIATLLIVRNPAQYGFDFSGEVAKYDLSSYDVVETNKSMRIQDISSKIGVSEENLSILNGELRMKITPDKTYKLKLPIGFREKFLQLADEIPAADLPRSTNCTIKGVFIKHKVHRGETLASIADKYKTSIALIRSANKISKKGLCAGQRLNIPLTKSHVSLSSNDSKSSGSPDVHKVQKGDTLTEIAGKYKVSVSDLKKFNNLKNNNLRIGQTIRLSQGKGEVKKASNRTRKAAAVTYKVKKGDNLFKIAKKKGIALEKLLTLNNMEIKDSIYPGQEIQVE